MKSGAILKIFEIFILRKDMSSIGYPGREKGKAVCIRIMGKSGLQ